MLEMGTYGASKGFDGDNHLTNEVKKSLENDGKIDSKEAQFMVKIIDKYGRRNIKIKKNELILLGRQFGLNYSNISRIGPKLESMLRERATIKTESINDRRKIKGLSSNYSNYQYSSMEDSFNYYNKNYKKNNKINNELDISNNNLFDGSNILFEKTPPKRLYGEKIKDIKPNIYVDLNEKYKSKYTFEKVDDKNKKDVLKVLKTIPKGWENVVYRHAIINKDDFSANKPLLMQNITYKTGVIYYPNQEKADIVPVIGGEGDRTSIKVGNGNNKKVSPLGSSRLSIGYSGKPNAVIVEGLEAIKKPNAVLDLKEAQNKDPSEIGNKNNNSRLIRVHEVPENRYTTWGCPGLLREDARKFKNYVKKCNGGGLEAFVSRV